MDRVLVTGATGLLGRATVSAFLSGGYEVIALSRSGTSVGGARGLACDLTDQQETRRALDEARASCLVHLAWHGGADRWHAPENLDWICHTLRLVRQFADIGGKRVVAAGSCAEYDWSHSVLSEATPLVGTTPYGAAKAACGLALSSGAFGDTAIAWARIFFVFGAGEPRGRLFGDLIRGLLAGDRVACTDGLQRRDFLHVEDVARALVAIAASNVTGPVNVAHGEALAVRDLIREVAAQLNAEDLVDYGALSRPPGDPDVLEADVTRLRQETGFSPSLSWTEAVRKVLDKELAR